MAAPIAGNNTWIYDALNRVVTVKEGPRLLADYFYDPFSRRTGMTYGNGFTAAYGYGANDDLTSLTHTFNGGSAVTFTYGHNKSHQRKTDDVSDPAYLWRPAAAVTNAYTVNDINAYTTVDAAWWAGMVHAFLILTVFLPFVAAWS